MSEESRETSQPTGQPTDIRIVGYCRTCGVGLDEANVRMANGTIYCADHVPVADATSNSNGQQQTYQSAYAHSPYTAPTPPPGVSDASPGTAFLLGMIPGVGAIYNGQYLKGLVHIFILGLLFTGSGSRRRAAVRVNDSGLLVLHGVRGVPYGSPQTRGFTCG